MIGHILCTFRIEIDGKDASDRTSLHLASMENRPDVIKILLGAQAVDSYVDLQGLTALHYAVENNSLASLRAFAELSDLTHIPDNNGRTPLMVASQNGFDQAVEILIKNPSVAQSIDYVDGEGKSGTFIQVPTKLVFFLLTVHAVPLDVHVILFCKRPPQREREAPNLKNSKDSTLREHSSLLKLYS